MLTCDLHIHTNYSRDGESRIEDIIRRAELIGLDAIAITDHDTIEGARAALTIPTKVIIIPGIEDLNKTGPPHRPRDIDRISKRAGCP